jgi:hypothetical protein
MEFLISVPGDQPLDVPGPSFRFHVDVNAITGHALASRDVFLVDLGTQGFSMFFQEQRYPRVHDTGKRVIF